MRGNQRRACRTLHSAEGLEHGFCGAGITKVGSDVRGTKIIAFVSLLTAIVVGFPALLTVLSNTVPAVGFALYGLLLALSLLWLAISKERLSLTLVDGLVLALIILRLFAVLFRDLLGNADDPVEKIMGFMTIPMCWFIGRVVVSNDRSLEMLLRTLLITTASAMVVSLAQIMATSAVSSIASLTSYSEANRLSLFGTDPITSGRTFGACFTVLSVALFWGRYSTLKKGIIISTVSIAGVGLILSGTRGALLATIAAVTVSAFMYAKRPGARWVVPVAFALLFGVITLWWDPLAPSRLAFLPPWIRDRFVISLLNSESSIARFRMFGEALRMLSERPFLGPGLGIFSLRTGFEYSHNLILDIALDTGLLGTLMLMVLLLNIARKLLQASRFAGQQTLRGVPVRTLAALALFYLAASQFSAGYSGNSAVWFALGMTYGGAGLIYKEN